jgi:hypothetical protein
MQSDAPGHGRVSGVLLVTCWLTAATAAAADILRGVSAAEAASATIAETRLFPARSVFVKRSSETPILTAGLGLRSYPQPT